MEQYISKSTLVAEIERIKKEECPTDSYEGRCKLLWFEQFLSFLDTLEVKEADLKEDIDLEKEVNQYYEKTWPFEEVDEDIIAFARHFFELGLRTQKGE